MRGAPPVAIISHDIWTRRFGADPAAIGRTIDLNGKRTPVIGVLPAGFAVPAAKPISSGHSSCTRSIPKVRSWRRSAA